MEFVVHSNIAKAIRLYGKHKRHNGTYTDKTLDLFSLSKRLSPDARSIMDYIAFQRDLGEKPKFEALEKVCENIDSLSRRQQLLLANFLLESNPEYPLNSLMSADRLASFSSLSPIIASYCTNYAMPISEDAKLLAQINNQPEWREMFNNDLQRDKGVLAIVGNSGHLLNSNKGQLIDTYNKIARFNQYPDQPHYFPHCGEKIDIWIQAPGLKLPANSYKKSIAWIVLTGPDIRYTLSDWNRILPYLRNGTRILTIPIHIWKPLVGKLQAPPSAGVLFIAWIRYLIPDYYHNVSLFGFQQDSVKESCYHISQIQKPSKRHNWKGENKLLNRWKYL